MQCTKHQAPVWKRSKPTEFDPLDFYDAPVHLNPLSKWPHLPVELLEAIALAVPQSRNIDLCNLALVCRSLRQAAQVALLKPARLPGYAITKLLNMLVDRPDLARRIKHVDLMDYTRGPSPLAQPKRRDIAISAKYKDLITKAHGSDMWEKIAVTKAEGICGVMRGYLLALLAATLPNLRELTFEVRAISINPTFGYPVQVYQPPRAPFNDTIMSLLMGKIKFLTVSDTALWKLQIMHNTSLTGLHALKCLSIPMSTLIKGYSALEDPLEVFPATIERLKFRACYKFPCGLLAAISTHRFRLPKLRSVDLFFKCSLPEAITLAAQEGLATNQEEQGDNRGFHKLFKAYQILLQGGPVVTVHSYTPLGVTGDLGHRPLDSHGAPDVCAELDAFAFLSETEQAMANMKGVHFSNFVARTRTGAPRARSSLERRLLLAFWGMPLSTFTSCQFDPLAWSGVRMFNGSKDNGAASKSITPKSTSSKTQKQDPPKPKAKEDEEICLCVLGRTPPVTVIAPASSTFDAAAWLTCVFFPDLKCKGHPPGNGAVESAHVPRRKSVGGRKKSADPAGEELEKLVTLVANWRL
jgi:hypothetical protein